jgi:hypothetical protein
MRSMEKTRKNKFRPVRSASKKLAPSNLAPLKFACLSIDCIKLTHALVSVSSVLFAQRF